MRSLRVVSIFGFVFALILAVGYGVNQNHTVSEKQHSRLISPAMLNRFLERNLPDSAKTHQLQSGELTRHFLVYQPENLKPNPPMVILLHGGGGSMRKNFIFPTTAQWLTLADQNGFLLISPNGVNPRTGDTDGNHQTWNGLRPWKDSRRSQADDVSFIASIIDWAAEQHSIDREQVYVMGASNGGELVFRLLIERPTLFAAGVANISSLPAIEVPRPEQGTPIMMMNGTEDPLMPWQGGPVRGVAEPVRPVPETVEYWIEVNKADKEAAVTNQLPDRAPNDDCRITTTAYPKKPNGKPVVLFYAMEGGGHSTPFPRQRVMPRRMRELLGNSCEDVDGTALAWDFMEKY